MRFRNVAQHSTRTRSGKTLVLFVLVSPVLIGMMGLIIDTGLLMASYRQTQNAADAAAMAAAMDLFRGSSNATALATAQTFVTDNGMSATLTLNGGNTTNTLNIPPQITTVAQYQTTNYAEVVVTQTVNTFFIQILGVNSSHTVSARAVAGYEAVGAGEGVFVLDSTVSPGVQINTNNTRLVVNGDVTINSPGGSNSQVDQYGNPLSGPLNNVALKTGSYNGLANIVASTVNVVGGTDTLNNIRTYDPAFNTGSPAPYYDSSNPDRPLITQVPTAPDPLTNSSYTLPIPTTLSAGTPVVPLLFGNVSIQNNGYQGTPLPPNTYDSSTNTTTLNPGIYQSIKITGGTVTFQPGIYVLSPSSSGSTTTALSLSGGTITGNGVMFYNTGSDYDPITGGADASDGNTTPNAPNTTKMGAVSVGGSSGTSIILSPLVDANSPFNGFLFYQRRWNTNAASFTASSGATMNFSGIMYSKWAQFKLAGSGSYQAQFLVGSLSVDGGATITINAAGKNLGKANLVFLVE